MSEQRVIAGRYQIGNLIGRGGMADVYEGVDTRLGRTVAIKLLKADLAADPSFEARFRQEAQASARMAHPTIVRVYDAGEDVTVDQNGNENKHPFIVMEYVRGTLLRDLLHERRLTIEEAINYTEGVLTALEFSHRAGVIHRDIKSANIMITESGQVKVMDFGIARAVSDSSATMAHTSGIVGTAQYFSPEQAKGESVDARTDLYSTGVLLYEMLAGRPPFKGDTAVSVAYQHVSEAVTPPSTYNPNLSPELDQVVMQSLAKEREARFQSAEEFRDHLLAAAAGSPMTQANSQLEPIDEIQNMFDQQDQAAQDEFEIEQEEYESPAVFEPSPEPVAATSVLPEAETVSFESLFGDTSTGPNTNPFAEIGVELPTNTGKVKKTNSDRPSAGILWGIGTGVTVVLAGLLVWVIAFGSNLNFNFNFNPGGSGIAVADVVGKTFNDGYNELNSQHLLVQKTYETSETIPADQIIRTDPPAGTKVSENTAIIVYVSSGAESILAPNLIGLTEEEARAQLVIAKLTLGTITQQTSPTVPAGKLIDTDPLPNASIQAGSMVNLIISNGKVMVPDVRNLSISDARNLLTAPDVALPTSIATKQTCNGTQGTVVVDQSILPGLVNQGSAIVIYVGCNQ